MYNNFEGDIIQLAENSGAHLVVYETILVYTDTELLVLFHLQSAVPIAISTLNVPALAGLSVELPCQTMYDS